MIQSNPYSTIRIIKKLLFWLIHLIFQPYGRHFLSSMYTDRWHHPRESEQRRFLSGTSYPVRGRNGARILDLGMVEIPYKPKTNKKQTQLNERTGFQHLPGSNGARNRQLMLLESSAENRAPKVSQILSQIDKQ